MRRKGVGSGSGPWFVRGGVTLAVAAAAWCCSSVPSEPIHVSARVPRPAPRAPRAVSRYIPWGDYTVESRLAEIGPASRKRWKPFFEAAGVAYPASSVMLVGLKGERRFQVYAGLSSERLAFVREYAITAASGGPGPKLREGDKQVPEGIYDVVSLNPNSAFHVSLRLGYPNDFDRRVAADDGRTKLGGDIMIHGGEKSIGCIALGDEAAEDLFVLSADAGVSNVHVVVAPRDFRRSDDKSPPAGQPAWVRSLYSRLDTTLRALPAPVIKTAGREPGRDAVTLR